LKANRKVYCAVAAILGAHAAAANAAAAAEATPTEPDSSLAIGEVVVTAQRREETIQNVPIQVTALTSETLTQLNITTFEDYLKVLPNVSASTHGPGQGQIYMRGLATTEDGNQSTGATGSFPNVAVYLDDQSAQLPGRNLDIYAADLERVEVLEGPQGTLFGAGAQAGVIRYITNKPKLNTTEAIFNGGYGITAHGDPSTNVDATVNLPLLNDKLAARLVLYSDSRGGYIDNVNSTFTRQSTDRGIQGYFGGVVPPSSPTNNDKISGRAINPVTYKGGRASLLYQINDDWNALVTQSYQNMEADGVFAEMPFGSDGQKLNPLEVTLYTPNVDRDKFENTSWTLNGRVGALKAVYTGGYLIRTVDQVADYTNYARGVYADYYQCNLPKYPFAPDPATGKIKGTTNSPGRCFSPVSTFKVHERNIHQSHELRTSTPDDWRLRGIGGLYWEQFIIHNESDWYYRDPSAGFSPLKPIANATLNNPNIRPPDDAFYDDVTRGYNQKAAFASIDFDIIPKRLTLTGGTRYYRMDTYQTGAVQGSFGCRPGGIYQGAITPATTADPCQSGTNLNTIKVPPGNAAFSDTSVGLAKRYTGFKSRANLTWHVTDDALVYYTWSQGFRPGGFNRASGFVTVTKSPLANIFVTPIGFKPDTLTNNELGWKTEWLDHRIQFNGAAYYEVWKDVQIGLFNPGLLGNLTFSSNGPEYHVRGIETEVTARVTRGLTVTGSASWNRSELAKEVTFNDKNGSPINFEALGLHNPYGTKGSPLAQSPPFQMNIRARYELPVTNDYLPFVQVSASHRGHSFSTTDALQTQIDQVTPTRYDQPGFTTYDASVGVSKDAWMVQLYGTNITNVRGDLYSSYSQFVRMDTVTRPRTLSLQMSYKFREK
jgi:iron complex outermembrane recepter protein